MNCLRSQRRQRPLPGLFSSRRDPSRAPYRPRVEGLEVRTLLSAGDLDPTFGIGGRVLTDIGKPAYDEARSVTAVQSDGDVIVVGTTYESSSHILVARYNPDGSLDAGFGDQGVERLNFGSISDYGAGVAVDGQGRIIVAGYTYHSDATGYDFAVARLTRRAISTPPSMAMVARRSTSVALATSGSAWRWTPRIEWSSLATPTRTVRVAPTSRWRGLTCRASSTPHSLAMDARPSILATPSTSARAWRLIARIAWSSLAIRSIKAARPTSTSRLRDCNVQGELDTTFDGDGRTTIDFGSSRDIAQGVAVDAQDRVVVAGYTNQGGRDDFAVARLDGVGQLDTTFGGDGRTMIDFDGTDDIGSGVAVDGQSRVVVAGYSRQVDTAGDEFAVARLDAQGQLDNAFDDDGRATIDFPGDNDLGLGVAVDSQDRIFVAGSAYQFINQADVAVASLRSDGALNTTFGGDGRVTTDVGHAAGTTEYGRDIVSTQPDGKIIAVGQAIRSEGGPAIVVARYNPDGSLDAEFGDQGIVIFNFSSTDINEDVSGVAIDSLGRIVVAGFSYHDDVTGYDFAVARLDPQGQLDTAFDGDGSTTIDFGSTFDFGQGVAVDSQDRVVVAGYSYQQSDSTHENFAVARLNADGQLDTTFDDDGRTTIDFGSADDIGRSVVVDTLDRVIVDGYSNQGGTTGYDFAVARLDAQGQLDTAFGGDGRTIIDFGKHYRLRTGRGRGRSGPGDRCRRIPARAI